MADWSLDEHKWGFNQYDPYNYAFNQYYGFNPPPQQTQHVCPQQFPPCRQQQIRPSDMAEWSLPDLNCPINQLDSYQYANYPVVRPPEPMPRMPRVPHCPPPQAQPCLPLAASAAPAMSLHFQPRGENPREVRNRAEKMRRDRLNQSVAELASMVPPVVAARRKIDKTTVLRLTAHYLRAHQYVFGDSIDSSPQQFSPASIMKVQNLFNGFLITTTYRGIIVVVSQNVNQYLGYTELDLLGQNLLTITHEGDRAMLREQLMPRTQSLGPNGELLIPDEPDAVRKVEEALANEKRRFLIRLKKLGQRSEPSQYVTCHVEGSLRKSDRACRGYSRCCQIVRRARARSENPCSSGNDIVFIGMVRPTCETFINESALESYRMEYRTRHSIDGEIIQCESRIALVTGYMTHEVSGVNAMNFMHRDDVRWVIIALREMYDQHRLFGESCYRLITKNGQCIYMRTRGCLDVDRESRAVTSFVCTNTVVDEDEGKKLIRLMKRKFTLLVNNNQAPTIEEIEESTNEEENQSADQPAPVEDPRRLEQVILHLVTNLPSPSSQESEEEPFTSSSPDRKSMSPHRLTIIPPNKERIVSAIEKIYSVIKTFHRDPNHEENNYEQSSSSAGSSHTTPQYVHPVETVDMNSFQQNVKPSEMNRYAPAPHEAQIVPFRSAHVSNYVEAPDSTLDPKSFNIFEPDYNSDDLLNAVGSPEMDCFDPPDSPFSSLTTMFANFAQNGEELFHENKEGEHYGAESAVSMPMPQYAEESNVCQELPQAGTSQFPCGTKRPSEFEDFEMVFKKKITENELARPDERTNNLFLSSQILTAISSLEQSIDPTFPELLISEDVQDILHKIEDDHPLNQQWTLQ
uniref:Methoprene-tolerant protein 2 n=1 Tax=Agrotis ipsilon TaxID=56364 RepID=A0A7M1I6V2_AGRIP|nr:methoprene-tolerant protein 2 [Agrotis ipsilon]